MKKLFLNTKYIKAVHTFNYEDFISDKIVEDYLCFDTYEQLYTTISNFCFSEQDDWKGNIPMDDLYHESKSTLDYVDWIFTLKENDYKELCEHFERYDNIEYITFDVDEEISLFKNDTKELLNNYTSFEQRAIVLYQLDCPYLQLEDNVKEQLLSESPEMATISNKKAFNY